MDEVRRSLKRWLAGELLALPRIEREVETHVSWVLLGADEVFKIRKPVRLPFLDYSTRALRLEATSAERDLGHRATPWVYRAPCSLDVAAGELRPGTFAAGEPVLVMTRMDESLQASRVFSKGAAAERIDPLVEGAVEFHARAPRVDPNEAVSNAWDAWAVNFEQLRQLSVVPAPAGELDRIQHESRAWFERNRSRLLARARAGRAREIHGDLRLEHVFLSQPWSVIDPLEFSERLRRTDVASEVAFPIAELTAIGREDAADRVGERYAELSGDPELASVLPFFARYRAVVRAKVCWFRAEQVAGPQREAVLAEARRHFEVATKLLLPS